MRKKSHISLAGQIVNGLELKDTLGHKYMFYFGSILPDCKPSFLTTPHCFQGTFEDVKEKVNELIDNYKEEKGINRRTCVRLGEVIHYIADYFTFPHNSNYDGNLKDHCVYENQLKHELRRYIRSGEAMEHLKELSVYESTEDLFEFIRSMHQKYLQKKSIVVEDCHYIVRVCMEVIVSLLAIFQKSFVDMRWNLAHVRA